MPTHQNAPKSDRRPNPEWDQKRFPDLLFHIWVLWFIQD